jgi:hypothetical protein
MNRTDAFEHNRRILLNVITEYRVVYGIDWTDIAEMLNAVYGDFVRGTWTTEDVEEFGRQFDIP